MITESFIISFAYKDYLGKVTLNSKNESKESFINSLLSLESFPNETKIFYLRNSTVYELKDFHIHYNKLIKSLHKVFEVVIENPQVFINTQKSIAEDVDLNINKLLDDAIKKEVLEVIG